MTLLGKETAWRTAVLAVAATLALAVASSASAEVRLQRGLAGVTIGMSYSDAVARLGAPLSSQQVTVEGGVQDCCAYRFPGRIYGHIFDDSGVARISTTSRSERTSRRVGVGSTLRQVRPA